MLRQALLGFALLCFALSSRADADEVRVAVAANFRAPCEAIARAFEAETGHSVVVSVGSTGSLFAQIQNGANVDVFLAADTARPQRLADAGRAKARFTYAEGRLVLLGAALTDPDAGPQALRAGGFAHLALANPETAPYGAAARQVLTRLGLWERLEPRVVFGQSVGQTLQLVRSGSAELGFVARSQVVDQPAWLVPTTLHDPIQQDAVLLTDRAAALAFVAFLRGPQGRGLIAAAGYGAAQTDAGPTPTASAWPAVRLTLLLALTTTAVLLLIGTPLAWWLAFGTSRLRLFVEAVVALPLVLPPTVLGFYLLVLLGPEGAVGGVWEALGGPRLVFSFGGLLIGSVLYSLPFVVQPLQNSFQSLDPRLLEAAATLRAGWLDRFRTVVLPLCRPGFLTAATLGFAHTVGEFGVVLMIGGSVPGRTKVLSIAIYDHVEQLQYAQAHLLAGGMLGFAFLTLLIVYGLNRRFERVTT